MRSPQTLVTSTTVRQKFCRACLQPAQVEPRNTRRAPASRMELLSGVRVAIWVHITDGGVRWWSLRRDSLASGSRRRLGALEPRLQRALLRGHSRSLLHRRLRAAPWPHTNCSPPQHKRTPACVAFSAPLLAHQSSPASSSQRTESCSRPAHHEPPRPFGPLTGLQQVTFVGLRCFPSDGRPAARLSGRREANRSGEGELQFRVLWPRASGQSWAKRAR